MQEHWIERGLTACYDICERWCVCGGRSFGGEARKIAQQLTHLGKDLGGKRDLAKLSPWLADYSAPAGVLTLFPPGTSSYNVCTVDSAPGWPHVASSVI
jgi:hypothetical protein